MQTPLKISFKRVEPSDALREMIRERVNWLERYYNRITRCEVVVERPHRRHQQGNLYKLKILIDVPGDQLVIDHNPDERHAHEDPYTCVHDAFDHARRRLEDYARRQRHEVKHHIQEPGAAS